MKTVQEASEVFHHALQRLGNGGIVMGMSFFLFSQAPDESLQKGGLGKDGCKKQRPHQGLPPPGTAPARDCQKQGILEKTTKDQCFWHVLQLGVTRISGPY